MSDRPGNRYSDEARAARKRAHAASSGELLPPERSPAAGRWGARDFDTLSPTVDLGVPRKFWSGLPDYRGLEEKIHEQRGVVEALEKYTDAATALETAQQKRELVHQERELLPQRKEIARLDMATDLVNAQQQLAKAQAAAKDWQDGRADGETERERDRELGRLDFEITKEDKEIQLQRKREERAQAHANVEFAERTAGATAEAAAVAKETELEEARRKLEKARVAEEETPAAAPDDGLPPEMAVHLRNTQRRRSFEATAARRTREILDSVGGDESRLTPEQLDEIDDFREAAEKAKVDLDKASATVDFSRPNGKSG
jgi:hypothetical protein